MTSFYHKYGIDTFSKGIEGNPFITRFKTRGAAKAGKSSFLY